MEETEVKLTMMDEVQTEIVRTGASLYEHGAAPLARTLEEVSIDAEQIPDLTILSDDELDEFLNQKETAPNETDNQSETPAQQPDQSEPSKIQ